MNARSRQMEQKYMSGMEQLPIKSADTTATDHAVSHYHITAERTHDIGSSSRKVFACDQTQVAVVIFLL